MLRVIILTTIHCFLLASGQVCFKLAVEKIEKFQWTWTYIANLFANWWMLASGFFLIWAILLWGYILRNFEFSIAYPITAIAYIFGMLAAIFIFHETVSLIRWFGVALIIAGVIFVAIK